MRVRYHLLIKSLFCSLLCFGLLSLKNIAVAQVYKSYDTNGNVVFSDKPTKRSKEVEIANPNLSKSFEIPPPAETLLEAIPEARSEPEPVTRSIADDDSADTNNDGRVSRREKEKQRKERRKKKHEKVETVEGHEDKYH